MNNPSPLVPQGSLLEQKNQSRARVRIAVFVVLAIHGIGLLALLMQGCNKPPETQVATSEATNTNVAPTFVEPTNTAAADTNPPASATNPPAFAEPTPPPQPPPAPATEYKVLAGDNLTTIARKFHVSLRALEDANPGIEPTKLKIGQTLHIPAANLAAGSNTAATAAPEAASGGQQIYTVKSGDNLIKIAAQFGISVRSLRTANDLRTDRIKVGDKLKIPAKAPAPTAASTVATSTPSATAPQ